MTRTRCCVDLHFTKHLFLFLENCIPFFFALCSFLLLNTFIFFFWCLALINHTVGEQSLTLTNEQKKDPPFFLVRICRKKSHEALANKTRMMALARYSDQSRGTSSRVIRVTHRGGIRAIIYATLFLSFLVAQKKCTIKKKKYSFFSLLLSM